MPYDFQNATGLPALAGVEYLCEATMKNAGHTSSINLASGLFGGVCEISITGIALKYEGKFPFSSG